MRIGIDYTAAVRQRAGIGRYTRGLVNALLELDTENEYVLLVASRGVARPRPSPEAQAEVYPGGEGRRPNVHWRCLPLTDRHLAILWHRLQLPLPVESFTGPVDLFHSPDFTLPPAWRARTLVTVHDLSFLRYPEGADPRLRAYLMDAVPRSVRRADHVLADSQNTRDDLVALLGVPPEKITVVYPGVEPRFRPLDDPGVLSAVRERYRLPERFILHVGTLEPRKNLVRLMEAYALLSEHGVATDEVSLVVAGGRGWLYEGIFQAVERLGLAGRVTFTGFVRDEDLPALYNLADLFVFPSVYEGFGLPPLEAMACGTPVVVSNTSSLPEVVGQAGLLVSPTDVGALAEAMARALRNGELRARLRARGLEQARRFTWQKVAEETLRAYRSLVPLRSPAFP